MPPKYERKKQQQQQQEATGLIIGMPDQEKKLVADLIKQKYKEELLQQIAEKQNNKVRAKTHERRVDATDLQKQLPEQKTNEALLDQSSKNTSGDASQELGDTAVPRAAGLDPRVSPLCCNLLHPSHPYCETLAHAPPPHGTTACATPHYGTPACAPPHYGTPACAPPHYGTPAYAPPHNGTRAYGPPTQNWTPTYAPPHTPAYAPPHNGTRAYGPPTQNWTPAFGPPPHYGTPAYGPPPDNGIGVHPLDSHHGTRNALEPTLRCNQADVVRETHQSGKPNDQRSSEAIEVSYQRKRTQLAENSKQQGKSKQSYNEVLKQQIQENAKKKEMKKREEEQYNAKIEAESQSYTYWGRGGGGAPLKDEQGNLHCDLKQMHIYNDERSLKPTSTRARAQVPDSHPSSALTGEPQSEVDMNIKHQQELKEQIMETCRRKAEERERIKREDEELQKKLEKQWARYLKEFGEDH